MQKSHAYDTAIMVTVTATHSEFCVMHVDVCRLYWVCFVIKYTSKCVMKILLLFTAENLEGENDLDEFNE